MGMKSMSEMYEQVGVPMTRERYALVESLTGEGRPVMSLDEAMVGGLVEKAASNKSTINPIDTADSAAVYWMYCSVEEVEEDGDDAAVAVGFESDAAPEDSDGQDEVTVECAELFELASERGEIDLESLMNDLKDFIVFEDEDEESWWLGPFTANELRGIIMSLQVQTEDSANQKALNRETASETVYIKDGKRYFEKPKDDKNGFGSWETTHGRSKPDTGSALVGLLR